MLKVFSYGGGVQSTAALVLAAEGTIDYRTFVFCNVGEDSENPATLAYVHEYAQPYAAAHGLNFLSFNAPGAMGGLKRSCSASRVLAVAQ